MPTIASFSATPITVPAGGGTVQLIWSASDASQLTIDPGVGDVSGSTSRAVTVTAGTTFTLTASNAAGTVSASTVVAVAAASAPTITSFMATPATLPLGGGTVTLSWVSAGATTLTIDNGVGDVSGATSKSVAVAANTTFTLTAANPAGSVTSTASVNVASGSELFFDAVNGVDTNPCTAAAPCRSLGTSLARAPAGTTFTLADGVYSQTNEGHGSITIPDGTIVRAAHPGAATLASLLINVPGSATFDGVVIGPEGRAATYCGVIGATPASGSTTLTLIGVFSNCVNWLALGGNVKATMTPGALPGGVYTTGITGAGSPINTHQWVSLGSGAELLITGGVVEGSNTGSAGGNSGVFYLPVKGTLTLDGVTVRHWPFPAFFATASSLTLRNGTVIDHVGDPASATGCAILTGNRASSLTLDQATVSNVPGNGICVDANTLSNTREPIQLTNSTVTHVGGAAIRSRTGGAVGPALVADGLSLVANGWGIYWDSGGTTTMDLRNTTITGSTVSAAGAGIYFDMLQSGASFKLRASTMSGNAGDGVSLTNSATGVVDLGTSTDPGGNTISGNAATGIHIGTFGGAPVINAVGNTWGASLQGTDAGGHYSVPAAFTPVPKSGPTSGPNFTIDNATTTLNL